MIARFLDWLHGLLDPHRDHSPAIGALLADLQAEKMEALAVFGCPAQTDAVVYDGPAMAQRLTLSLPLDLSAWIDAERGQATREEFVIGRLYIARILGDLEHRDIRSMQEALRAHGVVDAMRKVGNGH